jgi:transposase
MKNAIYGSNLTDAQWEYFKPMLPKASKRGRPRIGLRQVLDAIFYVVKGGSPSVREISDLYHSGGS